MGTKGEKQSSTVQFTAEVLVERFGSIKGISSKRMFGGHGIFQEGKMFCIIDPQGTAFLKVDDSNLTDYMSKGCSKHGRMPYYSIPEEILNKKEELIKWAEKSISISK